MASSKTTERIVVIGSGPCGLGAAYRLQELGHEDFLVLEAGHEAGGLSITATDEKGFLFDMGACVSVLDADGEWAGGRDRQRFLRHSDPHFAFSHHDGPPDPTFATVAVHTKQAGT